MAAITSTRPRRVDPEHERRRKLVSLVAAFAIVECAGFALVHLVLNRDPVLALALLGGAFLCTLAFPLQTFTGSPLTAAKWLSAVALGCIAVVAYQRGGLRFSILGWTLLFPIGSVLITRETRAPLRWGIALSIVAVAIYALQTAGYTPAVKPAAPLVTLISFLALTLTVTAIAAAYESSRRRLEVEMRELETRLDDANRANLIARFAGGVAHEVNTLLMVVQTEAELAIDPDGTALDRAAHRVRLRTAIERGTGLTDTLLRLTSHRVTSAESIDLASEVDRLHARVHEHARHDINTVVHVPDTPLRVRWQRAHVEHALQSLIENARDAMPDGGTVRVHVRRDHDDVVLQVSDEGAGMTDEVKLRATEPFYTTKPLGHATGLGLPTIDALARRAGGSLHIDSTLGQGTTVQIRLPLIDERNPGTSLATRVATSNAKQQLSSR